MSWYYHLLIFLRIVSNFGLNFWCWVGSIQRYFDNRAALTKVSYAVHVDNHRYGQLESWRYCSIALPHRGTACWEVATHAEQEPG